MGMFDHIRCEMPLPVKWEVSSGWQTKDLDCDLSTYTITGDGKLVRKASSWHTETDDAVIPYHGDIEFYDYDKDRGWLAFIARFTEGRCARIWASEWRPPHNKPNTPPPAGWDVSSAPELPVAP